MTESFFRKHTRDLNCLYHDVSWPFKSMDDLVNWDRPCKGCQDARKKIIAIRVVNKLAGKSNGPA